MKATFAEGRLILEGVSIEDFQNVGRSLARLLREGDIIFLNGQLGAGKTTLTQAIARGLGIKEDVVSPTFNIICSYEQGRVPLNHVDLYRLDAADQLDDIGFWELVDESTPGASIIEWAELFADEMPEEGLTVQISYSEGSTETREAVISAVGERARLLLKALAKEVG